MSAPSTSAYWSRQDTITLIDIYRSHECLWNVRSFDYRNRDKRAAAIRDIAQTISRSVNEVKKKLESLRNQHRRELRLMCTSKKSGAGSDEIHTPKLWCFDILSFLNDGDSVRPAVSNMSSTTSNQTTETVSEDVSDSEVRMNLFSLSL